MIKLETDYERMAHNIVKRTGTYVRHNGIKSLILGISGGVDSAATAALAREVCDEVGIPLIGMSLHTHFNKKEEVDSAKKVCRAFCNLFHEMPIGQDVWSIYDNLHHCEAKPRTDSITTGERIRRGNIAARMRMIYLYHMAHYHNGLVLSTDNLTENQLGFWTLHGDVGDYGLIGALWKTEVYGVASFLLLKYLSVEPNPDKTKALAGAIRAVPTDGLGITKSDFDQLGLDNYRDIDTVLIEYLNASVPKNSHLHTHPVIERHRKSAFKRVKDNFVHRLEILEGPKEGEV